MTFDDGTDPAPRATPPQGPTCPVCLCFGPCPGPCLWTGDVARAQQCWFGPCGAQVVSADESAGQTWASAWALEVVVVGVACGRSPHPVPGCALLRHGHRPLVKYNAPRDAPRGHCHRTRANRRLSPWPGAGVHRSTKIDGDGTHVDGTPGAGIQIALVDIPREQHTPMEYSRSLRMERMSIGCACRPSQMVEGRGNRSRGWAPGCR